MTCVFLCVWHWGGGNAASYYKLTCMQTRDHTLMPSSILFIATHIVQLTDSTLWHSVNDYLSTGLLTLGPVLQHIVELQVVVHQPGHNRNSAMTV